MKLVGNYLYLASAEITSKAVTVATYAYAARVIGRDGMGLIEFASSALLCAALAVDMGLGSYGAREIAKNPSRTSELTAQVLLVRLIMSVLAFLAMIGLARLAQSSVSNAELLTVFGISLLGLPFLLQWVFQGHEWMGAVSGLNLLRQLIFAGIVFAALRGPRDILVVAWAEVAAVAGTALMGIRLYRRWVGVPIRVASTASRALVLQSATIGAIQILWSFRMFGATVVLGLLATSEHLGEVAYFGGAMRILIALHAFIWLYYFNLLPSMTRHWNENRTEFASMVRASMCLVGWIAFAGAWLWFVLAPPMIRLVYGAQYISAGPVLQWMSVVALLAALSGHFRFGLVACGYQKTAMFTAAIGAVVALVLIPLGFLLMSSEGAAMGMVVAEASVWISAWLFAARRMGTHSHAVTLVKPLLSVVAVSLAIWLLGLREPIAQAAIGLVMFLVAGLVLDPTLRNMLWHLTGLPPRGLETIVRP